MSLSELLKALEEEGCYPCVSLRAIGHWRAHVNSAGNYWGEGRTPKRALRRAVTAWEQAGRPVDGYAASPPVTITRGES